MKLWDLPAICDCWYCKGGKNKHAWSFFYYLRRCGDRPAADVRDGRIYITVQGQ